MRTEAGLWLDRLEELDDEVEGAVTALSQELAEVKAQRDELLAVCEAEDQLWQLRISSPDPSMDLDAYTEWHVRLAKMQAYVNEMRRAAIDSMKGE